MFAQDLLLPCLIPIAIQTIASTLFLFFLWTSLYPHFGDILCLSAYHRQHSLETRSLYSFATRNRGVRFIELSACHLDQENLTALSLSSSTPRFWSFKKHQDDDLHSLVVEIGSCPNKQ